MGNPRRLYVADNSKPEIRQRQPQTNTRKCGTQPAHKSMPAVVKMPCLLLCSTASRMRAFVLKAGKERVMIKELANEHKRASACFEPFKLVQFKGFRSPVAGHNQPSFTRAKGSTSLILN